MALILSALGLLLVLAGITLAMVGGCFAVFASQLSVGGVLLLVAFAIERWRYKSILHRRPEPNWTDTGERFIDPETNKLTAVYFDATSSERHYIAVDQ